MPYNTLEKARANAKKRYAENPEVRRKQQEATAAWESTLPTGKWYTPEYGRRMQLQRRHKITPEQYDEQLHEQGDHCALCSARQGDDKRCMAVDHSHACCDKEVTCGKCRRGILCADCNRQVGFLELVLKDALILPMLGKDQSWTGRALRYLIDWEHKHKTQKEPHGKTQSIS